MFEAKAGWREFDPEAKARTQNFAALEGLKMRRDTVKEQGTKSEGRQKAVRKIEHSEIRA